MHARAALIGNPNCGKTTLFNALTGENQVVGNWPGVTVEKKEARFALQGDTLDLIDLPGAYSLHPDSLEEKLAAEFLRREVPDVVINVVDAGCLARGLYLTLQLIETGRPVLLVLNMWDELEKRGGKLDVARLEQRLGVRAVAVSARKRQGFDGLFAGLHALLHQPAPQESGTFPAEEEGAAIARRYARIREILQQAGYRPGEERGYGADRFLLQGGRALLCFCGLLLGMFFLTFGPLGQAVGGAAQESLALFVERPARWALEWLGSPEWVRSLVLEGVIGSVGAVIAFLPQMLLLVFCLCVWEDSGYMARAAFLADPFMRRIGLSGRAFIPLLMGFGCTAAAAVGARAVEREDERRSTILLAPFMSCGAKMPVYAWFTARLFPKSGALVVLGLYLLGMLMLLPAGKLLQAGTEPGAFAMEIPPVRMPSWPGVWKRLRDRGREFLARAGTLIFLVSVGVWLLRSAILPGGETLLQKLAGHVAPLLGPIGLGQWQCAAALMSGMAAKEAIVAALEGMGSALAFTRAQGLAFLVYVLLCPACLPARVVMRRECGGMRPVAAMAALQTALAWLCALCAYRLGLIWL